MQRSAVGVAFRPVVAPPRQTREHPDASMDNVVVYRDPRRRQRSIELPHTKMPSALRLPDPPHLMSPGVSAAAASSGYSGVRDMLQRSTNKKKAAASAYHESLVLNIKAEDLKTAFDNMDLDKNEFVGAAELKHVLAQSGVAATEVELDTMIKMADTDGKGQVSWDEFQLMFTKPFELFAKTDLSQLEQIQVVMQTKETEEYRNPDVEEPMEITGIRPVGVSQDTRRAIMDEFARKGENYIRPTDLKKLYERFREMDVDESGGINYDEFCAVSATRKGHMSQRLFSMFDIDGNNTISLREFIVGLSNFTKANVQETQLFAFQLYDSDNSGTIDESELTKLICANFAATEQVSEKEVREKVQLVYRSLGLETDRPPIDQKMWLDAVRKNPTLIAPVLDLSHSVEAEFLLCKGVNL